MDFRNLKSSHSTISLIASIILALGAFGTFLYYSNLLESPILMVIIAIFMIIPFRKKSEFAHKFVLMLFVFLLYSLFTVLGSSLIPFVLAFLLAYILDPIISSLSKRKIPRWLSSLVIVLTIVGLVSAVAVFVFPAMFEQLNSVITSLSKYVESAREYVESDTFYDRIEALGIPKETLKASIKEELLPRIESIISVIFNNLLSFLNNLSSIMTQLVNAILIPILAFYLLKDFEKFKEYISSTLEVKNHKLLHDLKRINNILKKYIGWQVLAATIVGTFSSLSYSLFDVPYAIVLGILAGLLNPIPYLGTVLSIIIGALTMLLVNDGNFFSHLLVILITINAIHFVNAYLLEPNIIGKQVGVHPVVLIVSLFIFSGLFGILGLLIAVPTTAAIMMFFDDWRTNMINKKEIINND